ncbi:hypothetical protein [Streptomyces sp. SAS_270]|uniref:hypothetical protein n=1 Tax=Streptomyces sp. SAS_270 TaxID=3412748 RepID=UPI00403D0391
MRPRALAAALLAPLLLAPLAGCAQSVDPIERLGKKAAQRVRPHGPTVADYRRRGLPAPHAPTRPSSPTPSTTKAPTRPPTPTLRPR